MKSNVGLPLLSGNCFIRNRRVGIKQEIKGIGLLKCSQFSAPSLEVLFCTLLRRSIRVTNGKELSPTTIGKHVEHFNELQEEEEPREEEKGGKQRILSSHRTSR
jgi:hypothetical protein